MARWYVIEGLVRETMAQARKACRRYNYDPERIHIIEGSLGDAMAAASAPYLPPIKVK